MLNAADMILKSDAEIGCTACENIKNVIVNLSVNVVIKRDACLILSECCFFFFLVNCFNSPLLFSLLFHTFVKLHSFSFTNERRVQI